MRGRRVSLSTKWLKRAAVRTGASGVFYSGALKILQMKAGARIRARQQGRKKELPFSVLLYHRVTPETDLFFPSQTIKAFEKQMRFLAQRYRVLRLKEIVGRINEGKRIEPWTIALTFDDGYRDNLLYAHRVLKQL